MKNIICALIGQKINSDTLNEEDRDKVKICIIDGQMIAAPNNYYYLIKNAKDFVKLENDSIEKAKKYLKTILEPYDLWNETDFGLWMSVEYCSCTKMSGEEKKVLI